MAFPLVTKERRNSFELEDGLERSINHETRFLLKINIRTNNIFGQIFLDLFRSSSNTFEARVTIFNSGLS